MPSYIFVISVLVALINFTLAALAICRHDKLSLYLGGVLIASTLVDITYTISLIAEDNFAQMSWWTSAYFSSMVVLCLLVAGYISNFTENTLIKRPGPFAVVMTCLTIADVALLMTNPLTELVMDYRHVDNSLTSWLFEPKPLYYLHTLLSNTAVAFAIACLCKRIREVPRVYLRRYLTPLLTIVCLAAANALFFCLRDPEVPDFSVYLYGFGGIAFYASHYHYAKTLVATDSYKMALDELDSMVVFFDYNQHFVSCNSKATAIVPPEKQHDCYTLEEFVKDQHLEKYLKDYSTKNEKTHFTWNLILNGEATAWQCLFQSLVQQGKFAGYLLTCSDSSLEIDPLTGFHTKTAFERDFPVGNQAEKEKRPLEAPASAIAFDINGLARINAKNGYAAGNENLHVVAECLAATFPPSTYFVRLGNGSLLAICSNMHREEAEELTEKVLEQLDAINAERSAHESIAPFGIQYAICAIKENEDVHDAINTAICGMNNRKLLDDRSTHVSLLSSLVQAQRQNDGETEDHVARTRHAGELLAKQLHLSDLQQSTLMLLCLMHDIGKIGVPLEIPNKPSKLNATEWHVMQSHCRKGYEIAKASPELSGIAELILYHHERWDGKGYPEGLSGQQIPLLSRIISIIDAYDAMTHDRPYRKAMPSQEAKAELERSAGTQFDPDLVKAYLKTLEEKPEVAASDADTATCTDAARAEAGSAHAFTLYHDAALDLEEHNDNVVLYGRYYMDDNTTIISADKNFTALTGYTKEDVAQLNLHQADLIPAKDRSWYFSLVKREIKKENEMLLQHPLVKKDGTVISVLCLGRRYFDAAERIMLSEVVITEVPTQN